VQCLRLAPAALPHDLNEEVASALPIEPQHHRLGGRRQEAAMATHFFPQIHQRRRRDVAAGEIKQLARPIVAMQPDPPTRRGDRQRELAAIAPFPIRRLDLGIIDFETADPAQRVANNRPLRRQLMFVRQMLELAAAAFVLLVVRTTRLGSPWSRLHDSEKSSAGESSMKLNVVELDEISGCGARDEHRAPIAQLADSVTSGGDPGDVHRFPRRLDRAHLRPSSRAIRSQPPLLLEPSAGMGFRDCRAPSSASAAATARAII
jgi:hypothetical protein